MSQDLTLPCEDGLVNLRVGAIILKDGKFLMVGNRRQSRYLYSVGGRIQFGETAEEAVKREVLEELGVPMEVDRMAFVHENFFTADVPGVEGKLVYEVSFFFYMKVPEDFAPVCGSLTQDGQEEFLQWVSPEDTLTYYPEFFRTQLQNPTPGIKHILTDCKERHTM